MTQALRPIDEIEAKYTELSESPRPETPEEDRGVYNLNAAGLRYDGKLAVLEWLLEEPRSEVDVVKKYRSERNPMTTCDRQGSITSIQLRGGANMLEWALQTENPEDPRSMYEIIDEVSAEVFALRERVPPEGELDESDLPANGDEVDIEQLDEELKRAWNAISDARLHMINGPEVNQSEDE